MFDFDYYFFNRPVSPHLSIHSTQISSILSILHRFSAIIISLIFFLVFFVVFNFYNFLSETITFFFISKINNLVLLIYIFFNFTIFFHILNGFRYILYTFNILTNLKLLVWFSYILITIYLIKINLYIF